MQDQNGYVQGKGGHSSTSSYSFWCSWRFVSLFLSFWCSFNLYALRANISVAMVCMVNNTAVKLLNAADTHILPELNETTFNVSAHHDTADTGQKLSECAKNNTGGDVSDLDGSYVWDKPTQGIILSSFFWGYLVTQIPGGWAAHRFGATRIIGVTMVAAALLAFATPALSDMGYAALVVVRVLQGLLQGMYFPAYAKLSAYWTPPHERSRIKSFSSVGMTLASVVVNPVSGVLCTTLGWPSIFYLCGAITILWSVFWFCLVTDSPQTHRYISHAERTYIVGSLKGEIDFHQGHDKKERKSAIIPAKRILLSPVFWAAVCGHTGATWGVYMMLTQLPTFMREVLALDIKTNGLYSALPYISSGIVTCFSGELADFIIMKRWMPIVTVRRLMNTLGVIVPAIFLVGVGYVHCSEVALAITMLTIGNGFFGFRASGYGVSHTEIGPQYADFMMGISNTIATIPGIVAPALTGAITTDQSPSQWQTVFWISLAVQISGALIYNIFISGDVQPWAKIDEDLKDTGNNEVEMSESQVKIISRFVKVTQI